MGVGRMESARPPSCASCGARAAAWGASGRSPARAGASEKAGPRARARVPRAARLEIQPLTPERWTDLEQLFGPSGAYSNCWCTYWRLRRDEFDAAGGARKKAILRGVVDGGDVPGLLAYRDGAPVGWVAVQPREAYPTLDRSPRLKRVDDAPVWSITCFFVAKAHRRTGVMRALLDGAVAHARASGATTLEGYPTVAGGETGKGATGYQGLVPAFERAGFREVARPSARQRIMRRALRPSR